jgi:23S rRNA (adenine2030-N6)-methyltransferase
MKYRHSFHAGNFADVHKHVTLLALIAALQRKDKGFLYFETHAGRGLYDLHGAEAQQGGEARQGIGALRSAVQHNPVISSYLAAATSAAEASGAAHAYAGSPLLAARALRAQDRGVCCEIQPPEFRALERALSAYPRMRSACVDGYGALSAHLPPVERRALVLIDPPYEDQAGELERALAAIVTILQRLANAVVMLWYPIKDERELRPWRARAAQQLAVPVLRADLWLHPRDSRVALNGSGLLLVNPPYDFDSQAGSWLPALATALGADRQGGTALDWIPHEPH